jgi:predicted ATPase/Tfp pilus assembly protein PilF
MLIEQGGLEGEDGTWQVTSKAVELVQAVPGTLNGLVLARFDPLPEDLRRTLQKAAVLGTSFPVNLLLNLNGAQPDKLAAQLGALETRQFLIASQFGDGEGYSFRHALIQDVVYHTLLKRDRQKLHQQVAQVIERGTYWLPDEQTEAIAYHFAESTTPSQAVPYLISAGENAARRCAYETAIQHYRRALALMPDQPTRYGDQFLRAQVGLAQALKFVGQYTEAAQILEEAFQHLLRQSLMVDSNSLLPILVRGLSELADIRVREGASDEAVDHLEAGLEALGEEGAQAQPQLWRSLIDRLAWVRFRQGKLEQAFSLASSATLGLDSEKRDDPVTLASLYNTLGGVFWQWGNLPEATDYVEHSLTLYQSLGYAWGMAIAYTNLGVLHYVQGMWPQAAEYFEQAYTLRRENGYLPEQALNLNNLGLLRMAMGDHSQAQQDLEASLAISRRLGDDFSIALAEIGLGHLALVQGHFEQAAAHIEVTLDRSDIVGEDQAIQARWLWALIQAERGNLQAGLESGEQALQMAREASLTEVEADCRRVLGVLHARAGDDREAESLLREAVDLYLQVNAPYGEGQALLELGSLYQQLARPGDQTQGEWQAKALTALTSAIERFESLGAAFDLQRAHAFLSQCKGEVLAEIPLHETRVSGTDIASSHSRQGIPEGEWHTAAIVWLDLSPPPDVDEEAMFETLSLIIPDLTAIAVEHQGRVIRRQDGLTVVYGAPTAYEDDTERAVKTAWSLVRHLGKAAHQNEVPLTCQVAVSQGEIVAGHIGPSFHTSFTVKGEPVQSAQQTAESASPGKVWVTEAVRAATERYFVYQPAPSPSATEPAAPVLFEVVGLREQAGPTRGVPGLKAKLIGRDTPLQAMAEMAKNLSQDIGGLIWIEGEPGIGKSRLMREFADLTASTAPLVWAGRCTPQRSSHVFSLFSHLFTQALDLQPTDTPDQIRDRIYQATQTWPRDAQMTRPYLEVLLGVQPSGLDGERLSKLEPEQLRQQVFVALRRLLKSLADEQPLVLLLDDLHWIDPISAELLQFLLSLVTSTPILFVCAQRRQGADSPNDRLVRAQSLIPTQTLSLRLDRLSTTECKTLLNELLPGAELPARLLDTILERSEGNPYFIEEYIRVLIEQGHLQHHEGGWVVALNRDLEDVPLPSSLETLIRSRVDALPTDLKQLIQYASVIGTPFEASLLAAVAEIADIKGALARLESRLLVHRGSEAGRWEFSHLLFETVVYNSILKARRKTIHQKVARALEARWAGAETEHAEELAYHYTLAGESGKALTYLVLAGERAAAQYANEEAKSYFEQAVQQLGTHVEVADGIHWRLSSGLGDVYRAIGQYTESIAALEEGLARATIDGNSSVQRASLCRRLGDTTLKQGELDATHEHFAQALTILGELNEPDAQAEVARVLHGLAWIHFVKGHFDQAREACEASMQYARSVSALSELASAENLLGGIFYRQSDWKPALHHTMRAMILREQMGYTWGVAATLGNLGVLAVSAGHWSKARSFFERSLALRHDMGDVEGMAIAHNNLGMLARDQGELELAEFHFKESLAVATPFKIAFHVANATINLAQVFLRKDEIERAQEAIVDSLDQAKTIGAEDMLAEIYWIQAEIHLANLAWDESRAHAEQSATLAAETGNRSLETAAWRVISEVELLRGNLSAAHEALAKAQQAMSHGADELETGRVAAVAGQIHLREGQSAQAEEDFRVAQEIFMRLGASPDLKRVESALV